MSRQQEEILTINGVNYFVTVAGMGTPTLLLHGFTGSCLNWSHHLPYLARHYQVIAPDILGHGRSASPAAASRYQMEQVAKDLEEIIRQLTPDPVHLLGYSMGGRLALYLALAQPTLCRSLILESASPGLKTAVARNQRIQQDRQLAQRIEQEGIEAFVNFWEQIPLFATQQKLPIPVRTSLRQQRLQNQAIGLANSLRGMGTGQQPNLWPQLNQLTRPTLLLVGEQDSKFVNIGRQMATQLPQAQLHSVSNAGHTIHLEKPNRFNQLVLDFWATTSAL